MYPSSSLSTKRNRYLTVIIIHISQHMLHECLTCMCNDPIFVQSLIWAIFPRWAVTFQKKRWGVGHGRSPFTVEFWSEPAVFSLRQRWMAKACKMIFLVWNFRAKDGDFLELGDFSHVFPIIFLSLKSGWDAFWMRILKAWMWWESGTRTFFFPCEWVGVLQWFHI